MVIHLKILKEKMQQMHKLKMTFDEISDALDLCLLPVQDYDMLCDWYESSVYSAKQK